MKKTVCLLMTLLILFAMMAACSEEEPGQPLTDCRQAQELIKNGMVQQAYHLLLESSEEGAKILLDHFAFIPRSIRFDESSYREFIYDTDGNLLRNTFYIHGKIYEEDIYTYYASGNVHTIEKNGSMSSSYTVYNEQGRCTSSERTDYIGHWDLCEYNYDENGNKTVQKHSTSRMDFVDYTTYRYDPWGNCLYSHTLSQNRYESYSKSSQYTYDESQNIISEEHTSPDGGYKRLYEYDNNGNLTRREEISVKGLSTVYLYERNSNGKIIKRTTIHPDGSICVDTYEYDQIGNEIYSSSTKDGIEEYSVTHRYDENNNLLEYVFSTSGKVYQKNTQTFDEYGNVLVSIRYQSDKPEEYDRFNYIYDELGRVIDVIHFDMENRMSSHQEYTYDQYGHIVAVQKYDKYGALRLDYISDMELRYYQNGVPEIIRENYKNNLYRFWFESVTE